MYKVSSINAIIRAIFPSKWSGERKYHPHWLFAFIAEREKLYIISVGLSALLVSTDRAMRRP